MKKMKNLKTFSKAEDLIGTFYFFVSPPFRDSITGHAWIAIKNESDEDFEIGNYTVGKGEYVSLGLFGPVKRIRIGLFYNMETLAQHGHPNKFKKNICVYHKFTKENLKKLNEYINFLDPKSYRVITNNCCHFAAKAWNCLYGDEYKFRYTWRPSKLFSDLMFSVKCDFLPGTVNVLFENDKARHY